MHYELLKKRIGTGFGPTASDGSDKIGERDRFRPSRTPNPGAILPLLGAASICGKFAGMATLTLESTTHFSTGSNRPL